MKKPLLAITLGDPAGIGPEVVLKSLKDRRIHACSRPLVVGDARLLLDHHLKSSLKINPVANPSHARFRPGTVDVLHLPSFSIDVDAGKPGKTGGDISFTAVEKSLELAASRIAEGLVHAPISKAAWKMAGVSYTGHTELLADIFRCQVSMAMASGLLRTVMVTRHIALKDVPKRLKTRNILLTIGHALGWMRQLGFNDPRIGVCALNPHAGESGLFGLEELKVIAPAIRQARKKFRTPLSGPLPSDAAFRDLKERKFDCLVTMFHDQSMIPLKLHDAARLVNITLGLPFARTSPGHGTAFDIAGKNVADPRPMTEAILECARLCKRGR